MKHTALILTMVAGMVMPSVAADSEARPHTPKPGTPVRTAICDAMRKHVRQIQGTDPKLKFLWKIDTLLVLGDYACFQGYAVKPDGGYLEDDSMVGDSEQTTFLRRNIDGWWVIADLTRGDVPSADELRQIRGTFPAEIPTAILPEFWKKKLR